MIRRHVLAAVVIAGSLLGGACAADQDPGLEAPNDPGITSNTLGPCPPGGPDESMPAGCLDPDGRVVRPGE